MWWKEVDEQKSYCMVCMVIFGKEEKQHMEGNREQTNKVTAPDFIISCVAT